AVAAVAEAPAAVAEAPAAIALERHALGRRLGRLGLALLLELLALLELLDHLLVLEDHVAEDRLDELGDALHLLDLLRLALEDRPDVRAALDAADVVGELAVVPLLELQDLGVVLLEQVLDGREGGGHVLGRLRAVEEEHALVITNSHLVQLSFVRPRPPGPESAPRARAPPAPALPPSARAASGTAASRGAR